MPVVHRNVLKAARQALKRRTRNRAVLSGVKGVIKKLQTAIQQKQAGQATELLREASRALQRDRKSTRLNSSHGYISYAVFCLKKKNNLLDVSSMLSWRGGESSHLAL